MMICPGVAFNQQSVCAEAESTWLSSILCNPCTSLPAGDLQVQMLPCWMHNLNGSLNKFA